MIEDDYQVQLVVREKQQKQHDQQHIIPCSSMNDNDTNNNSMTVDNHCTEENKHLWLFNQSRFNVGFVPLMSSFQHQEGELYELT
jgi:hypothetical protein